MASIFIGTDTDGKRQSVWETGAKQVARTVGSQVGLKSSVVFSAV